MLVLLLGQQVVGVALDEQFHEHRVHDVPPPGGRSLLAAALSPWSAAPPGPGTSCRARGSAGRPDRAVGPGCRPAARCGAGAHVGETGMYTVFCLQGSVYTLASSLRVPCHCSSACMSCS